MVGAEHGLEALRCCNQLHLALSCEYDKPLTSCLALSATGSIISFIHSLKLRRLLLSHSHQLPVDGDARKATAGKEKSDWLAVDSFSFTTKTRPLTKAHSTRRVCHFTESGSRSPHSLAFGRSHAMKGSSEKLESISSEMQKRWHIVGRNRVCQRTLG